MTRDDIVWLLIVGLFWLGIVTIVTFNVGA